MLATQKLLVCITIILQCVLIYSDELPEFDEHFPYWSITNNPAELKDKDKKVCSYWSDTLDCKQQDDMPIRRELFNLGDDKMLKAFKCDHCQMYAINAEVFRKPEQLQTIELRDTNLKGMSGLDFKIFPNLETLHIEKGDLENFQSRIFPQKLRDIKFRFNHFPLIQGLQTFSDLVQVDLSSNDIHEIDSSAFLNLVKLERLDLSNNLISSLPKNLTTTNPNLKYFSLHHNRIFSFPSTFFDDTKHLLTLDISYNPLFDMLYEDMFRYSLLTVNDYKIDGLPCSTLKYRIINYLESEFFKLPVSQPDPTYSKYLCKRDINLIDATLGIKAIEYTLKPDIRNEFWYEDSVDKIKCIDFFHSDWKSKIYSDVSSLTVKQYAEYLSAVVKKLLKKDAFTIEMLTLNDILKTYKQQISS